jgi:hypothetical protein
MKAVLGMALVVAFTTGSGAALAQATQNQLVGGWTVATVVNEDAGQKFEPYGPNPIGYMSLGANGHYSIQLMRPDLPKIASNNRIKTTPEESAAIAQGLLSHYGTWKLVDPKTGEVTFHIQGSSFPNWNGADQKRFMMVKGDTLTLRNPTSPTVGTATVAWMRAK